MSTVGHTEVKGWTWCEVVLEPEKFAPGDVPHAGYVNEHYTVWIYARGQVPFASLDENRDVVVTSPSCVHLSIKRNDRAPIHDWRDLQRIKNELLGPEVEAVELYPAESRLVDTSNQYHLHAVQDHRFPFGYLDRCVVATSGRGAVQRPFPEDALPPDALGEDAMGRLLDARMGGPGDKHPFLASLLHVIDMKREELAAMAEQCSKFMERPNASDADKVQAAHASRFITMALWKLAEMNASCQFGDVLFKARVREHDEADAAEEAEAANEAMKESER